MNETDQNVLAELLREHGTQDVLEQVVVWVQEYLEVSEDQARHFTFAGHYRPLTDPVKMK